MPLSPTIDVTITLNDLQGNQPGSVGNPAFVEIALANFGPTLPRVPGTAILGKVGPWSQRIPYEGAPITVTLWGNDVITPANTYYVITIFDDKNNILQSAAYVFTGALTADLSTLPQAAIGPAPSGVNGGEVNVAATPGYVAATPQFNCGLVNGPVEFYLLLTANVASSTLLANYAGQIVMFRIAQNGTGGWTFVWPSNVKNPGIISAAANATTSQAFFVGSDGNAYPLGPQTYS
jgi:hypothetical protein